MANPATTADTEPVDRTHDERYQRLMAEVRGAARGGYDAVSMRDLARSTHMSMTTIYQYCSSKDHLIAEAHLEWMERIRHDLVRRPPRGRTARTRVHAYIGRITAAWEQQPTLTMALQRALSSTDPGVRQVRTLVGAAHDAILEIAIGDAPVERRGDVIAIIGHVINSVTHDWAAGTLSLAEARRMLERTVDTLLPR